MSNHTRAPASQDEQVLAIINELRRSDARGRLLMFEVLYAFDHFDKRVGGWNQEDRNILRAKIEAIRKHLFPKLNANVSPPPSPEAEAQRSLDRINALRKR